MLRFFQSTLFVQTSWQYVKLSLVVKASATGTQHFPLLYNILQDQESPSSVPFAYIFVDLFFAGRGTKVRQQNQEQNKNAASKRHKAVIDISAKKVAGVSCRAAGCSRQPAPRDSPPARGCDTGSRTRRWHMAAQRFEVAANITRRVVAG